MKNNDNILHSILFSICASIILCGCTREDTVYSEASFWESVPISLSGGVGGDLFTRADDNGFADGDAMGVYIADRDSSSYAGLYDNGNRADNVRYVFNASESKWTPVRDVYWKDNITHIDVYGYYPYQNVGKVHSMPFTVSSSQNADGDGDTMGGYEASDFLWGSVLDVAPTDKRINISFLHRMAGIRVVLVEGAGFADGEWDSMDKDVLICGTRHDASIDLVTGNVTATGDVSPVGITPLRRDADWRAVVVPQEISSGSDLVRVTVGGYSYRHVTTAPVSLAGGRMHNFTITVNKREAGNIEFSLSGEDITAWDAASGTHETETKAYIVINVDKAGTLDSCITRTGRDLAKIKHLKLTGTINSRDFAVMRYGMPSLNALNLKDVRIVAGEAGQFEGNPDNYYLDNEDDVIPLDALRERTSLVSLILPSRLKIISGDAFRGCNLAGALAIPDGVEEIRNSAFYGNSFGGRIEFPVSLRRVEMMAFCNCGIVGDLALPEGLEYIGDNAFSENNSITGLYLPESLTHIGQYAFSECRSLSGDLRIPRGITKIPAYAFWNTGFDGTLYLHDDIVSIGQMAFSGCMFSGRLVLPRNLVTIGGAAFRNCNKLSGELDIPASLESIGESAFYDTGLSGILNIPSNVRNIGYECFSFCNSLSGIVLPESLESIGARAFAYCAGIGKIVCRALEPPIVGDEAFEAVPKDKFIVEVPVSSVQAYRTAKGWSDFKRISSYHNFSVIPDAAAALNDGVTRTLTIYADDEWEMRSRPGWVTLDRIEGVGKTEINLTFSQMPRGMQREGEVVFRLKRQDYTLSVPVRQYDYSYGEDEMVTLQRASVGRGVNVVFIGDGYDAEEVSTGRLLSHVNAAVEHFFAIEPYRTYREYFNVYAGIAVSPESGIGTMNTIVCNRFNTTRKDDWTLGARSSDGSDYAEIFRYACMAPTVDAGNIDETLIVMLPNDGYSDGICYLYDDGSAIAYCPDDYNDPNGLRATVQRDAGGYGFGKLGDESHTINAFCPTVDIQALQSQKRRGWCENLSLNGKAKSVDWSHLIFHEKYRDVVDVIEGGYGYTRGVFRSESNSCMSVGVPYYNTISRESVVRRIMRYAGEEYSFGSFVEKDSFDVGATTRGFGYFPSESPVRMMHKGPVMMGTRPLIENE